jgi:hypothetical protein
VVLLDDDEVEVDAPPLIALAMVMLILIVVLCDNDDAVLRAAPITIALSASSATLPSAAKVVPSIRLRSRPETNSTQCPP